LKGIKKRILSNVKFIAELIISKILRKKIIRDCLSSLFHSFFSHFYSYTKDKQIEDSIFDFYFEAIVEFIENIGDKYESLEEAKTTGNYNEVEQHCEDILTNGTAPKYEIIDKMTTFTKDEYFELLQSLNSVYMKAKFPRLSALLQNLVERR
jgi:hypothetical protein